MHILVTNDDGIHAPGLRVLVGELTRLGRVTVVAPDRERSGAGHAITVQNPLRVTPVEWEGGVVAHAVDGTPADCIKLGLDALVEGECDAVVSGINRGPNLGTDVIYSGTVSGAREGYLHGLPAIAASLDSLTNREEAYLPAARLTRLLLAELLGSGPRPVPLLNVNIPAGEIRGVRITRLGVRKYRNVFHRREDPRGRVYYWLAGEAVDLDQGPDTDARALREGYASVTPLRLDLTDAEVASRLRVWETRSWNEALSDGVPEAGRPGGAAGRGAGERDPA